MRALLFNFFNELDILMIKNNTLTAWCGWYYYLESRHLALYSSIILSTFNEWMYSEFITTFSSSSSLSSLIKARSFLFYDIE